MARQIQTEYRQKTEVLLAEYVMGSVRAGEEEERAKTAVTFEPNKALPCFRLIDIWTLDGSGK